jgi:hypothetical protein
MATNNFASASGEWNTAGNWSLNKVPDNTDDLTFTGLDGSGALTITTTYGQCKSLDFSTAGAAFTFSGTVDVRINGSGGNVTTKTGMTWSQSGRLYFYSSGNLHADVTLGCIVTVRSGATCTLDGHALVLASTKDLEVFGSGTRLITNDLGITCRAFTDSATAGGPTLTLGSSTITCTNVSFTGTAPVVNHTGTINLNVPGTTTSTFGYASGTGWGTVIHTGTATAAATYTLVWPAGTPFVAFNIAMNHERRDSVYTIAATATCTDMSWIGGGAGGGDPTVRPIIRSSAIGTARAITCTNNPVFTDIDVQDIQIVTGTPTGTRVGDCGGNTNAGCSAPKTVYAAGIDGTRNGYDTIWVESDGTEADYATRAALVDINDFPLPQDSAFVDDKSLHGTSNTLNINYPRRGGLNVSGATVVNTISIAAGTHYGSLNRGSRSGFAGVTLTFDARVGNNVLTGMASSSGSISVDSYGNTVSLYDACALTAGTFTLTRGTFDLNGNTLTTAKLSSANANTRKLHDDVGGGKIVVTGVTGTVIDLSTDTNLTIEDAPDIQMGTGALTLTANATMAMNTAAKTFGDLTFQKHAGDYNYLVTGASLTFGAITQQEPDAAAGTYPINKVTWPGGSTISCTSYTATGASDSHTFLTGSSDHATLSDTTGTNTFIHCTIQNMDVTGGATWDATNSCTDVSGNSGWTWTSGNRRRQLIICGGYR